MSISDPEKELREILASTRRETGRVFVLSGPSGVGKDTLLAEHERVSPNSLHRCVTMTTRPPRQGEAPGQDYHFVGADEFRRLIEAGELLEWAEVHGRYYGTPLGWVRDQREAGRDVVLKIDVQGGLAVKRRLPETIMVFVAPPSFAEMESRLRGRHSETEPEMQTRLKNALGELSLASSYDYLIVNDSLATAASELAAVVAAERCKIRRRPQN